MRLRLCYIFTRTVKYIISPLFDFQLQRSRLKKRKKKTFLRIDRLMQNGVLLYFIQISDVRALRSSDLVNEQNWRTSAQTSVNTERFGAFLRCS